MVKGFSTWHIIPGPRKIRVTPSGGKRYEFPGVAVTSWRNRKINQPTKPIVPRAWTPPPATQRAVDIARRASERRARERAEARAREQAEQERARARARSAEQQQAGQRKSAEAVARQLAKLRERTATQLAQQRKRQTDATLEAHIQRRRQFERQRQHQTSQREGTWLGTMLAGMAPLGFVDMRPVDLWLAICTPSRALLCFSRKQSA